MATRNEEGKEELQIVFPKGNEEEVSKEWGDELTTFPVTLKKIADWFKDYKVDNIQLSISAAIQTGTITRLLISASGQGGMTVTLKPKG